MSQFPDDFIWGTATASYQVEGAVKEDGRGESIWDKFCRTPGNVVNSDNGDIACDQYHRYKDDVKLIKEAGIQSYRFSICWTRIFPNKRGELNPDGFKYYHNLIEELLANNITPAVTLYHWELPQYLEDEGGWGNRETSYAFQEFAEICFKEFSSTVKFWITLNEPWCIAKLGYFTAEHAPGKTDRRLSYDVYHHLNLAHGLAVKSFKEEAYEGDIGITLNLMLPRPATKDPMNIKAAELSAALESRVLLDPLYGRGYPKEISEVLEGYEFPIMAGDMDIIKTETDFIGINYYNEAAVVWNEAVPDSIDYVRDYYPTSDMGWPTVPEGLLRMMHYLKDNYGNPPMYVTENGFAAADTLTDEEYTCHDPERIDYLKKHFKIMKRAIDEGVNLKGYYLWSFIDNFEWAYGYSKRFGIVFCDYENNLARTPKDSYYFYREVIGGYETI